MTLQEAQNADPAIAVADIARDFYRAWADGDVDRYRGFVGEETRWFIPGSSAIAGQHAGAAACEALRSRLTDLRQAGCIVLVATHDLETIDSVADRAVLLRGGRLTPLDQGPGSLRERYRRASRES